MTPIEKQTVDTDRQVCLIRFSPCGNYLFGGGYDAQIHRWQVSESETRQLAPVPGHNGWVSTFAFSSTESTLFSADSWGQLCAWSVSEGELKIRWQHRQAHQGWIRALAVSSDSSHILTAGRDGVLRVWSAGDGSLVQELTADGQDVFCVCFHPGGEAAVSGDLLGTLRHWDLKSGTCVRELMLESMHRYERIQDVPGLKLLQFDECGERLVCAGGKPTRTGQVLGIPTIQLIEWESLAVQTSWELGAAREGFVFDLRSHPRGFWMVVTSGAPGAGQFLLLRPTEKEPFFSYTKMSNCHSLAVHPEGKTVIVSATNRNSQGNGAVLDKEGKYLGNFSPLRVFEFSS